MEAFICKAKNTYFHIAKCVKFCRGNSIDWEMLITVNIPERSWARISPCGSGCSAEQTKELAPALLLFSGLFWMPQWTRTFLFGSRAWKWHPEDPKWPLAEALEGAPEPQPARDSPSIRPGNSTQPGPPGFLAMPIWADTPALQPHTQNHLRGGKRFSLLLTPPCVSEPLPSFPAAAHAEHRIKSNA